MTVYNGKLLELLSIEKNSEQVFLRINLLFEQDKELYWEIDNETANNIEAVTTFEGLYKYRLSFHSFRDSETNQYISFLTRNYRNESKKIYFTCSEDYVNKLNAIKQLQYLSQLHTLSFLSFHHQLPINKVELKSEKETVIPNRFNLKIAWVSFALLCVISTVLLGFSGPYLKKTTFNEDTLVKAEGIEKQNVEKQKVNKAPAIKKQTEKQTVAQNSIPFVKMKQDITYSIPKGKVALTFDDGPSKYTKEITDILNKYEVGGTFFFIGQNVKNYPNYVKYVHTNGHSIGNHSMNHKNFTKLSYKEQKKELLNTNELIEKITHENVILFRPPYGAKNNLTTKLVHSTEIKMVLWNKDTEDWKYRNSQKIYRYVQQSKASGSIILLHENQAVVDALPKIIEYLQDQDLQIVSLK